MVQSLTAAQPQIQGAAGASLGEGFQAVYLTAGIAAAVSALLTLFISGRSSSEPSAEAPSASTAANAAV